MAYDGLNWQKLELSLAGGLQQKADDRARPNTYLDRAVDVQYDEDGGVQTRFPFGAEFNSIFGGGTLSNCRRLGVVNDELVVFTDTAVYSWNAQLSAWVLRATHLAVAVDETPRFVTTGDQIDGDRAELNGTVVYAWTEGTQVYAAAIDKTTGSVLVSPTAVGTGLSPAVGRPRLVALATKILLFADAGGTALLVRAIDPANPVVGITSVGTTILVANYNLYYDVVRVDGQDIAVGACRRSVTTSYTAFTCTAGLAVVTSTKARTADGPLAVATISGGTQTQIVRGNGTNIQGDLLTTSTLADVFTGQAIGTGTLPINQIAVTFASTTATVFWSSAETSSPGTFFTTNINTVTTANVVGTAAQFNQYVGVASRAFTLGSSVYVWLVFAGDSTASAGTPVGVRAQLQNTYYLYRSDGHLVSKAVFDRAGGFSPSIGHLPGVVATSSVFAWCGAVRRVLDVGGVAHSNFGARSPLDITFTFDSNAARRTARIGATLYIADGIIRQYDGVSVREVGFLVYPWSFGATALVGAPGAAIPTGTYTYKATRRWVNARGETERSTTATGVQLTFVGTSKVAFSSTALVLTVTQKGAAPAIEIWRQEESADVDAPFYLITSADPNATGDNGYIPNAFGTTVNDNFTDAILTTKEKNPENGAVLERLAPPGASIIIATDTRVFLGAVAGDPDAVWYSQLRKEGEVASFHDGNRALVPRTGGAMTALTIHGETPTVFRATAIYKLAGDGLNNLGEGQNFIAFDVAKDVGAVSQETIGTTPRGTIFKSRKGWYLLHPGWDVEYIGAAVSDYDSETVYSVDVVETQHQVRILTSGRMLIWDYLVNKWGEWSITDGVHSLIWNGAHVYLTATGPKVQGTTYTALTYGMDVELADIKLAELQGATRCRKVQPLGEYRSACLVRLRIAYNYARNSGVPSYVDDKVWTPSPTLVSGPLQFSHGTKRPVCESIKVRITAVTDLARATMATASLAIPVQTSGTNWAATWRAVAPGELGNSTTMSLAFVVGVGAVDVRDHFTHDPITGLWSPDLNNIGVLVTGTPTVAQFEAAIVAGTALATLSIADATPGKVVNVAAMAALAVTTGSLSGGTFGSPTGEAIKLTAIGLEVGLERPGLFNRLPAAQRQ